MQYLLVIAPLLLLAENGFGKMTCPKTDNKCACFPGPEFEFHCPPDYERVGGIVMHYLEDSGRVSMDCYPFYPNLTNVNLLPHLGVDKINTLQIRFCPLPENGFEDVLKHLGINEVKSISFQYSGQETTRINATYFEGLETLKFLNLERNGYLDLDEDVFSNTPNLIEIQLSDNKLALKPNLFKNTLSLKSIDISRNELTNLPVGLFRQLKDVVRLHLWQNNLTEIDEFTFEGLSNLKSLELSVNKIRTISENSFRNLTNLTQISLTKNNLIQIPANLFQENTMLTVVRMRSNVNLNLSDYLFSNLPLLETVDLGNCTLESIPEHIFENSTNLKTIILDTNRLKHLSPVLFKGLANLEELKMHINMITDVSNVFTSLTKLKKLYLQNNSIKVIKNGAFTDLSKLEEIYLQRNEITDIHFRTFDNLNNLTIINLSHNKITTEDTNSFLGVLLENNSNLVDVNLSHNRITDVTGVIKIYNKVHLKKLDLSHNDIAYVMLSDLQTVTMAKYLVIRLDYNDITTVDFTTLKFLNIFENRMDSHSNDAFPYSVIYLDNNPVTCDCHNYDLLKYFRDETDNPTTMKLFDIRSEDLKCASPSELAEFPLNKLSPQLLTCPLEKLIRNYSGCPQDCSCDWRPFNESVIINCSDSSLDRYPEFILPHNSVSFRQTELHLERNNLTMGPDSNLTGYDNVTKLFLSYNQIRTITWLPSNLEVLKLDNNRINSLNHRVLTTLNTSNLETLTLNNNPWLCECEAENLTYFLRQHTRQVDANHVYCNNSRISLIDLNRNDLCHEWEIIYVILPVLLILLMVAVTAALYYRYEQELKIWLFAKNLCLWWVSEEDTDKDKIYDAFISYSHKDEDFVTQNLLPRLESGPKPYKLCLHYRNFVPGEFISKQVTNSVLDSRRTLVVLSPNFLESVWGKLEFRTAHTQAMAEGRFRVIIVLYGDIDVNGLDDELKAYLKTNTYIKWGDPHFWDRLVYALPHSRRNVSTINQKHANVMNCIDDKFKLVTPVTGSPGSTPPVLTLDPSLLKHPLAFVPSAERDTPPAEAGSLLTSTGL